MIMHQFGKEVCTITVDMTCIVCYRVSHSDENFHELLNAQNLNRNHKMSNLLQPRIKCFVGIIIVNVILFIGFNSRNILENLGVIIPISDEPLDKWIVVTTTNQPNAAIEKLATIPGWTLLVVGDSKTPSDWKLPNCIYLGIDQQMSLNYSIIPHIPFDSYSRKNIGYLYAIEQGAQYIYDTNDVTQLSEDNLHFFLEPTMSGLIYADTTRILMNPYAHFGQPSVWPRGFPFENIKEVNNNTYRLTNFVTPTIQHGLVSNDSHDVDASFGLVKVKQKRTSSIEFDECAPPVTLPVGVFSPINSHNTLFHRDAFWALMLPPSLSSRIMDIWRGYWAQKLMWLVDQRLAVFPPTAVQISDPYTSDQIVVSKTMKNNKTKVGEFVQFLSIWNCTTKTLFGCITQLSSAMVDNGLWNVTDHNLLKAWLYDLQLNNYLQPEIQTGKQNNTTDKKLKSVTRPKANHTVYFSPTSKFDSANERLSDMLKFCGGTLNSSKKQIETLDKNPSYVFSKILLVIIFNEKYFKNIKFLDTLYRDHFPNIVICSPMSSYSSMIHEVDKGFPQWRTRQITFVNMTQTKWYFAYECAIRVIEMNYRVDGYMVIGDDTLLNFWNLPSRNLNEVNFKKPRFVQRGTKKYYWMWLFTKMGQNATGDAFDEIEKLANSSPQDPSDAKISQIMKNYVKTRQKNNIDMKTFPITITDIYYFPQHKANEFKEIMKIFLKHKSFLEMANPATMAGLYEGDMSEHILRGNGYWGDDRNRILSFFNATNEYLHPIKLPIAFNNAKFRKKYCNLYIRQIIEKW